MSLQLSERLKNLTRYISAFKFLETIGTVNALSESAKSAPPAVAGGLFKREKKTMSRIRAVNPAEATGKAKDLLDAAQKKLGITPNMMKTMAQSHAVLEAYLNFSEALASGSLNAKEREQIALAVGEANGCGYCVSAHTAIGKIVGLSEDDINYSRQSSSGDVKTDAALKFARTIVLERGEVSDADVQKVREAGFSDGEIAEIIANVSLNIFTNYFNHIAGTEIDFPKVELSFKKSV
jgi:uncharacterized peroxidase-related enzyme